MGGLARVAVDALLLDLLGRLVVGTTSMVAGTPPPDSDPVIDEVAPTLKRLFGRPLLLAAYMLLLVVLEETAFFLIPLAVWGSAGLLAGAAAWGILHVPVYAGIPAKRRGLWIAGSAAGFAAMAAGHALLWATPPLGLLSVALHYAGNMEVLLAARRRGVGA
jgi:hypothetical protein